MKMKVRMPVRSWHRQGRYTFMAVMIALVFVLGYVLVMGFAFGEFHRYPSAGGDYGRAVLHIAPGVGWFLGSLVQLTPSIRHGSPSLHRWVGYASLLSLAVSLIGMLSMVAVSNVLLSGWTIRPFGYIVGAHTIWLMYLGLVWGRRRDIERHRDAMIRVFSIVLLVPLSRPILGFMMLMAGVESDADPLASQVAGAAIWVSWPVSVFLGEVYLSWQYQRGLISAIFHTEPSQLAYPLVRLSTWTDLRVVSVIRDADVPDAVRLRLALRDPKHMLVVPPGHHVYLGVAQSVRPYTPIRAGVDAPGYFDLLVKTYHHGVVSQALASSQPGDVVAVRGPAGGFVNDFAGCRHVGMVAGGSGITPLLSVLKNILADDCVGGGTMTIKLLYVARTAEQVLARSELDALANTNAKRFSWTITLTQATGDQGSALSGRPDAAMIQSCVQSSDAAAQRASMLLVCGPPSLNHSIVGMAAVAGFPDCFGFGTSDR